MTQPEWMHRMLATVDAKDAAGFAGWFTPDAVMRYGSGEPMVGPGAIRGFCDRFFCAVDGIAHRVLAQWDEGAKTICQGECSYLRKDGRRLTLPFMTLSTRRGDKLAEYLVYMDAAPLFAP
jgi:ketosteroid isomerase-like protein